MIQTELSGTLGVSQDQTLIETDKKAFGISSYESNAMKSPNPNSGFYEADTSRTLDNNGGNPACHQGGIAVCDAIPVEGNGYRPLEQNGCDTYNGVITGDTAATLTANSCATASRMGPKVLEKHSYGLDHVMLSGGTTYQGRGYYNEQCGCLKTQAHGVAEIDDEDTDT